MELLSKLESKVRSTVQLDLHDIVQLNTIDIRNHMLSTCIVSEIFDEKITMNDCYMYATVIHNIYNILNRAAQSHNLLDIVYNNIDGG